MIDWFDRHTSVNLWAVAYIALACMYGDTEPVYDSWYTYFGATVSLSLLGLFVAWFIRGLVRIWRRI